MKIQNKNSISFAKNLRANCNVLKNGSSGQAKIYQLYLPMDNNYLNKTKNKQKWALAKNWYNVRRNYAPIYKNEEMYVLEDEEGSCLGFIGINNNKDESKKELLIFETAPKSKKEYKYVGETLLAYIAGLAKKDSFKKICVPVWTQSAEDFYIQKCGFEFDKGQDGLSLKKQVSKKSWNKTNSIPEKPLITHFEVFYLLVIEFSFSFFSLNQQKLQDG